MAQKSDTVFINGLYTYTNEKSFIVSKNSLNVEKFLEQLKDPDVCLLYTSDAADE